MDPTKKYKLIHHRTPNEGWKEVKDPFPYRNPRNAYMWGAIHGMIFTAIMTTVILYIIV